MPRLEIREVRSQRLRALEVEDRRDPAGLEVVGAGGELDREGQKDLVQLVRDPSRFVSRDRLGQRELVTRARRVRRLGRRDVQREEASREVRARCVVETDVANLVAAPQPGDEVVVAVDDHLSTNSMRKTSPAIRSITSTATTSTSMCSSYPEPRAPTPAVRPGSAGRSAAATDRVAERPRPRRLRHLRPGHASASLRRVSRRCSGMTLTSARTGMKFVSPLHRGTTWTWP